MKIKRSMMFNQMSGKLFRELAEDISIKFPERSELYMGKKETGGYIVKNNKLKILASPPYDRKSKITRISSWLKFTFFSFFKMIFAKKDTLIFITTNPPLIGFVAWLVCKIRRLPYVILVYDIYPDIAVKFKIFREKSIIVKIWRFLNKLAFEGSYAVYTIGDFMADNLSKQFNPIKTKLKYVEVITPWADTNKIKPIKKSENPLAKQLDQLNCITVLYSGNMGKTHDIDSILKAAKLLKNKMNIKFLFFGDGEKFKSSQKFVKVEKLNNVKILPLQSEDKFPFTLALGDISIASLDKGGEGLMLPSKIFYYLAAGSAIIGICEGKNDLAEILIKGSFGFTVRPGSYKELTKKILFLAKNTSKLKKLKDNARASSVCNYSRKVCVEKLEKSLKSINLLS